MYIDVHRDVHTNANRHIHTYALYLACIFEKEGIWQDIESYHQIHVSIEINMYEY